jgi:hypothetical protein
MNVNKKFILPEKCERVFKDCKPLSLIKSEDNTFLCCGLNKKRNAKIDIFRHCFKSGNTDTIYDYSKKDILSTISIFSESLNIMEHIKNV